MHWGGPFRTAARHELTAHQQATVEEASDKLIGLREQLQQRQAQEAQEVLLTDEQAALLIVVVEECLDECGSEPIELSLQLKTSERNEVEILLQRIRTFLGSRFVKLA
jgi:hypothetical protein